MLLLKKFINIIEKINEAMGKGASYLIFVFMTLMVYEVIARYFFASPTIWVHEICGQLFAGYVALTGGWVLLEKGHVAVDIIYQHFPKSGKLFADILVSFVGFFMFSILFWQGYKFAWHAVITNQHSHTIFGPPMWPVKMMIPAGALFFLLQLTADLAKTIVKHQERSVR
ncbi:TRAP-type mannitol/chloroaromatic compound transport system, small permease component [Desulfocicer vacuolatum DSM 3385]|uniref:TRAP-type mannitol/chloroaromatic compound transport system, small permease component n=1 Tax=Desulfocicer vacuolatum DSM 3385 TaxID=1121400 RepID=A0A1W2CKU2_9BACT|nr:TRAP transporter small permease subunit [Desulfocicer vacuolatum]SMC85636.1 TRAP-type mannitol/chloroaromatic compound transport system, small permease component [Desulfocicer vacuolatum DSM 3385]